MSSPSTTSTKKFSGIFVSYRREDSAGHAGRLFDRLVEHFGRDRIFMDIDTIEPGEDFVTVIENAVGSCDVLIAVIGRNWLSPAGSGRLDKPTDFVRLEIATALRREIRVIPVLVQRASLPKPQDLPEDLVKLTRRNAVELTDLRWQTDVDQLITVMERVLAKLAEAEHLDEAHHFDEEQRHQEVEEKRRVVDHPPASLVTAEAAPPAGKYKHLILIAGVSLVLLLAVVILIWQSQRQPELSSNTYQPPATPTQTAAPSASTPTPDTSEANVNAGSAEEGPNIGDALWKRDDTGDVLQISRRGSDVIALMYGPSENAARRGRKKGDVAFEGLIEGRTITGTAYLLFSETDVERCTEFAGDHRFALELTLSEDGNTLSGSRENFELSNECNVMKLPRKSLSYTRLSR